MAIVNLNVLSGDILGSEKAKNAIIRAKNHGLVGLPKRSVSTDTLKSELLKSEEFQVPTCTFSCPKVVVAFSRDKGLTYVVDKSDFDNLIK